MNSSFGFLFKVFGFSLLVSGVIKWVDWSWVTPSPFNAWLGVLFPPLIMALLFIYWGKKNST